MTNAPVIDLHDTTKKNDDSPPAPAGVTLPVASLIAGLDKRSSGTVTVNRTRVDQLGEAGPVKWLLTVTAPAAVGPVRPYPPAGAGATDRGALREAGR